MVNVLTFIMNMTLEFQLHSVDIFCISVAKYICFREIITGVNKDTGNEILIPFIVTKINKLFASSNYYKISFVFLVLSPS